MGRSTGPWSLSDGASVFLDVKRDAAIGLDETPGTFGYDYQWSKRADTGEILREDARSNYVNDAGDWDWRKRVDTGELRREEARSNYVNDAGDWDWRKRVDTGEIRREEARSNYVNDAGDWDWRARDAGEAVGGGQAARSLEELD
ncbi:hypothetical protein CALCODRAFT_552436 [Calocera cornea HHB12733]|uniref:Uncharacterized protein n=1 Tax=Calocera cornea HHB12733 TaxID=1353952 RepID=A0A165K2L1_9BASI|nr:hypothetical protein CALCODRAFT_552436 [Calocera cornea HHB12733]